MSSSEIEKAFEVEAHGASSNDNSIADPEKIAAKDGDENGDENEQTEYLSGVRLGLIVLGLCLAVLLVGLVGVSQPREVQNN